MNPPQNQVRRRTGDPGAWRPRLGLLLGGVVLAGSPALRAAGAGTPTGTEAQGLTTVLQVARLPDQDLLVGRSGDRLTGRVQHEAFHLRTAEGDLAFPLGLVAGLDLSDDRSGLCSIITVNRNRFTGFLAEKVLRLQPGGGGAPSELRRETVLKAVFHRRSNEGVNPAGGLLVRLRNGDFFTGQLLSDRFRVADTGVEVRWAEDGIVTVTFPHSGNVTARLRFGSGEVVSAQPTDEDLDFELELGFRLTVYAGRIDEMTRAGVLPADLAARIGAPMGEGPAAGTAAAGPDPEVRPRPGMVWIPPGAFSMGSPLQERGRDLDEGPVTRVVFPAGFWIGRHEVTQAEYLALLGKNPSQYEGQALNPVEKVSWQDASDYCRRLTEQEHRAGHLPEGYTYRLPTEAEWEYACRAGTSTRFSFGDDEAFALIRDYAWFSRNGESTTHPVGTRKPNAWGLFDLHGNVLEWCLDAWRGTLPGGTVTNVAVAPEGTLRAVRGGSWLYEAPYARSANRDSYGVQVRCSDLGFRVVLARGVTDPVR